MTRPVRVLLVEDNPDDVLLTRLALAQSSLPWDLAVATDGEQALTHLAAEPADLVLLDLKLPKVSGLEVLTRLRATPGTQALPVVVLTSSANAADIQAAHAAGASLYLQKPLSLRAFTATLRAEGTSWLALRPSPPESA